METSLRILYLEDDPNDLELVISMLEAEGFNCEVCHVDTRDDFVESIETGAFNIILSDYSLPAFDGLMALKITKEKCPDVPFILVSGSVGEERAIEIITQGATDYVLKERLSRLVPAVKRILQEVEERNERKRAEEALRESEERYRELVEGTDDLITRVDMEGRFTYVNHVAEKIVGVSQEECVGMSAFAFVHPDDRQRTEAEFANWVDNKVPSATIENRQMNKTTGEIHNMLWTVNLYFDQTGDLTGINSIARDLTERKRAEEALRESEEKYRSMMEAMDDATYICSSDFRIEYMNRAMINRIGRDATGEPCHGVIHGLDEKCSWCIHEKVMSGEYVKADVVSPLDDKAYHISDSPIFHTDGSVSKLTVFHDLTEMKKLEAQLQQAQKMEAIGTLAGGIAHDFNNILMAILGHCDLAKMQLPEDSDAIDNLNQVKNAGNRARNLIKQILAFSRMGKQERIALSPTPLIKEALKFLKSTLPTSIEIRDHIEADPGIIEADATQIHQIMMNLCTNADHAMREEGGTLDVKLRRVELDRHRDIQLHELHTGPHVRLTVNDTGCGIDSETLEHIFDPYFTTKEVGEGTGLGLSVVHGIVNTHGGAITVASEPGKGTSFNVYFPVIDKEETMEEGAEGPLPTGNERILFVDDDKVIVEIGEKMLGQLGYDVVVKTSSVEALELFQTDPDRFDLVITDMTMPKMTGDQFARELMKVRPNIPVILCTGFNHKISEKQAKEIGIKAFAMKPLVRRDMANIVRKALGD